MTLLATLLKGRVTHGQLTVIDTDGGIERFGTPAAGWPDVVLRLNADNAVRRILLNPRLGLGEAYMDGAVSVDDDDILGVIELIRRNNPWENNAEIVAPRRLKTVFGPATRWLAQRNTQGRSRANVAHHYDLSNDFYRLWLDEGMQYSCAYWADPDASLEQAQTAKLAHIAAKLALQPGMRVLDIGCGWGGMALYLNRVAGASVLGITLSEEQLAFARARAEAEGVADTVQYELIDYRDLAAREPRGFDRIVSVGMFEHVGAPQFDAFFRACANLMTDSGVMLLHTIGRFGGPGGTDAFTQKYIFPGGYIPALSETIAASEKARLIASDVETWRLHYARTLRHWYARIQANRDAIVALYDVRFYRMWTFYIAGAATVFEAGGMGNYQIQFVRNRHALPITRDYIAEAEAGYAARTINRARWP